MISHFLQEEKRRVQRQELEGFPGKRRVTSGMAGSWRSSTGWNPMGVGLGKGKIGKFRMGGNCEGRRWRSNGQRETGEDRETMGRGGEMRVGEGYRCGGSGAGQRRQS